MIKKTEPGFDAPEKGKREILVFDAKGCYDRIVTPLQSISSICLGAPKVTAIFFAHFWRCCQQHVRTWYEISSELHSNIDSEVLFEIGQGNGTGPVFWHSTLIVMFAVLDEICQGTICVSTIEDRTHESTGFGFVDNVTLGSSATENVEMNNDNIVLLSEGEEDEVHSNLHVMVQSREQMLCTNGDLLEFRKRF